MPATARHPPQHYSADPKHPDRAPELVSSPSARTRPRNALKTHDNSRVQAFISEFVTLSHLREDVPEAGDLFMGVSLLKSHGDTATRALSQGVLFGILAGCPVITTAAITEATGGRYARSTVEKYAAHARVLSKAMGGLLDAFPHFEVRCTGVDAEQPIPGVDGAVHGHFLTYIKGTNETPWGNPSSGTQSAVDLSPEHPALLTPEIERDDQARGLHVCEANQ